MTHTFDCPRNPWEYGEQRKTPCCGSDAWLLDNTLNNSPDGSRWECADCHRVWCWSSMIKVEKYSSVTNK